MKIKWMGVVLLLALFPLTLFAAPTGSPRPIVFVHGFSPLGTPHDCKSEWSAMETTLASKGFTGSMTTIGYYGDDTNCDVKTSPKGTILTSISSLSHDLAWYIYNEFSVHGVSVDIVAHSMGGLMVRYGLYRVAMKDSAFPPLLMVSHTMTLSAPYTGYSLSAEACHVNVANIQCDEMYPGSSFINGLQAPQALVPQGQGGTLWANVGSKADVMDSSDGFVTAASATSMEIPVATKVIFPWHMMVFHTDFTGNKTVFGLVSSFFSNDQMSSLRDLTASTSPAGSSTSSGENQVTLSRAEVYHDFDRLPQGQRPAEIKPYSVNNQTLGVVFTQVLPGGLFAQMGIQNNDNVRGCTAATVDDPFGSLTAFENSGAPFSFDICIFRNGTEFKKGIRIQ